jgi:hypothetical protein
MKMPAVMTDDAGGFLSTMLEGMQAKCYKGGGFPMSVDAKYAAFLMQLVIVKGVAKNVTLRPVSHHGFS